jgi:hypothetical protein
MIILIPWLISFTKVRIGINEKGGIMEFAGKVRHSSPFFLVYSVLVFNMFMFLILPSLVTCRNQLSDITFE